MPLGPLGGSSCSRIGSHTGLWLPLEEEQGTLFSLWDSQAEVMLQWEGAGEEEKGTEPSPEGLGTWVEQGSQSQQQDIPL